MKQTLKRDQMYLVYISPNTAHVVTAIEELQVNGTIIKIWFDWQGERRLATQLATTQKWVLINSKF